MNWKLKAKIQNIISYFPSEFSYNFYYWIQRHFGSLKDFNPINRLSAGMNMYKQVLNLGESGENKIFYEVGTGRAPIAPLAYWLMGAKKTITIDLNPYVKTELITDSLKYIRNNKEEVIKLFGSLLNKDRLDDLIDFTNNMHFTLQKFLDFCSIEYIAPGDASNTNIADNSIDYFTSCAVFEHIERDTLKKIIIEGNRIIKKNGLFINYIDYRDHFSSSDRTISAINFLQYSDDQWKKYADNKYMYMNRLRHDDYINLFRSEGHNILAENTEIDQNSKEILKSKRLKLDEQFKEKLLETLSIRGAMIVSRKLFNE
ncbi:MAG: methyltransferase domain-containing protein [Candidatus Delongbacteria bacterium]|nr:methyltransferase domain-containing protein [Candidatus Delongbacteria bacterium]